MRNAALHPFPVLRAGLLLALAASLGLLAWSAFPRRVTRTLFPNPDFWISAYDDRAEHGASELIVLDRRESLRLAFVLRPGVPYPYAGLEFVPNWKPASGIQPLLDVTPYDSLTLRWRTRQGLPIRIMFLASDPDFTERNRPLTRRYYTIEATPGRTTRQVSFAISDFSTPPWWFQVNRLPLDPSRRNLDRIVAVAIHNGESFPLGVPDTLVIESAEFVGRARGPWLAILAALAAFWTGIGLLAAYRRARRLRLLVVPGLSEPGAPPALADARNASRLDIEAAPRSFEGKRVRPPAGETGDPPGEGASPAAPGRHIQPAAPAVEPDRLALPVPPAAEEKAVAYLAAHYHEAELTIEQAARDTALSPRKFAAALRQATGEMFKERLNRLRLAEAQRLLRLSDLQVAEIAFRVGYGSVSHFNRLYRAAYGLSPSEQRAAWKGTPDAGDEGRAAG